MKKLTATHVQVVKMLAQGMKTNTIAQRLCVSPNTVRGHRAEIYHRLGVRNSSAAVAAAIFDGYITEEEIWQTS